jgi:hypothetical protein
MDNISRHINRLEQQFCCGDFSAPDPGPIADLKAQIPEVLGLMRNRIQELTAAKLPYRQTILWIAQFVDALEHISRTVWVEPELAHYQKVYPGPTAMPGMLNGYPEDTKHLIMGRNNAEIWRTRGGNEVIEPGRPRIQDTLKDTYMKGIKRGTNDYHLPEILAKQEAIVIPSYNPLDTIFFRKTRPAPLYVLALIDFKYLIADRTYMTPQNFFNHDCFHVVGTETYNHQNLQLWDTLQDDYTGIKLPEAQKQVKPLPREAAYRYWNNNAAILDAEVQNLDAEVDKLAKEADNLSKQADANPSELARKTKSLDERKAFRDAVNTVLFTLVHEPLNRTNIQDPKHRWCVMPEKALFFDRLNAKGPKGEDNGFLLAILERFHTGFFGRIREGESYNPAQLAAIEDCLGCSNCTGGTCTGTTDKGKPCVKGWITHHSAGLEDFPSWLSRN